MFGLGKQKLHLGQATRLIATSLINLKHQDYREFQEVKQHFTENELELINSELFLLRFPALNIVFASIVLENRYSIASSDVGKIVSYASRLAFQDAGYEEHDLMFLGKKFSNDIESYVTGYEQIRDLNHEIIAVSVADSFTNNFLTSIGINNEHAEWHMKKAPLVVMATSVIVMIRDVVLSFLKNVKIAEFR